MINQKDGVGMSRRNSSASNGVTTKSAFDVNTETLSHTELAALYQRLLCAYSCVSEDLERSQTEEKNLQVGFDELAKRYAGVLAGRLMDKAHHDQQVGGLKKELVKGEQAIQKLELLQTRIAGLEHMCLQQAIDLRHKTSRLETLTKRLQQTEKALDEKTDELNGQHDRLVEQFKCRSRVAQQRFEEQRQALKLSLSNTAQDNISNQEFIDQQDAQIKQLQTEKDQLKAIQHQTAVTSNATIAQLTAEIARLQYANRQLGCALNDQVAMHAQQVASFQLVIGRLQDELRQHRSSLKPCSPLIPENSIWSTSANPDEKLNRSAPKSKAP